MCCIFSRASCHWMWIKQWLYSGRSLLWHQMPRPLWLRRRCLLSGSWAQATLLLSSRILWKSLQKVPETYVSILYSEASSCVSLLYFLVECVLDSDCRIDQICHNHKCINPCLVDNPCAVNAECRPINHQSSCFCPPGLQGDPYVDCKSVECLINQDCPQDKACIQNRCVNPCLHDPPCAPTADCRVRQHSASCVCPPGTIGNPFVLCSPREEPVVTEVPECVVDTDCPSGMACLDQDCKNPCYELEPCDKTAFCEVIDTAPFRTMICSCKYCTRPKDLIRELKLKSFFQAERDGCPTVIRAACLLKLRILPAALEVLYCMRWNL